MNSLSTAATTNPNERYARVCLRVRHSELEAMDYLFNHAGMANPLTCNALSLALKRLVHSEVTVAVKCGQHGSVALLESEGQVYEAFLSDRLHAWLDKALKGHPVGIVHDWIMLPVELLEHREPIPMKRWMPPVASEWRAAS